MYIFLYNVTPFICNSIKPLSKIHLIATTFLWLLVTVFPAAAKEANVQYTSRQFTTRDGLPRLQVTALAQDSNGYLWIGTKGGLARYDGLSFTTFLSITAGVSGICQLRDGRILVSCFRGLHIIDGNNISPLYTDSRFSFYFCEAKVTDDAVYLVLTGTGNMYDGCILVSFNLRTKKFTPVSTFPFNAFAYAYLNDTTLLLAGNNSLRGCTYHLIQRNGTVSRPYTLPFKLQIRSNPLLPAPGYYEAGASDGNIYKLYPRGDSLAFTPVARAGHRFSISSTYMYRARDGSLFYCSEDNQLVRHRDSSEEVIAPLDIVHRILEDREGNSWVATEDGLYNFFNFSFKSYEFSFMKGRMPFLTGALAMGDGTLWLGSYTNGLWKYTPDGSLQKMRAVNLPVMYHPVVRNDTAFFPLSGGLAYAVNGTAYSVADSAYAHLYLYNDPVSGRLLSGTSGISYFENGKIRPWLDGTTLGLQRMFVLSMCRDKSGKLWYTSSQGAGYVDGQGLCHAGVIKNTGSLLSVVCDGRGNLWLAGTNGLFFYNHRTLTQIQHPSLQVHIGALHNYKDQYLLVNSSKGLALLDLTTFYNKGRTIVNTFTYNSGFTTLDYSQNSIWEHRDGSIFISAPNTLLSFYPKRLPVVAAPFKVHIEDISASHDNTHWQHYSVEKPVHAPTNNIRVHFNAVSFAHAGDIVYRCRLRNFSDGWEQPTRVTEARYTRLDPGDYVFEVQASINGADWTVPTSTPVHIGKAWYQTTWFHLLLVAAALGVGWLFYRDAKLRWSIATLKLKQLRNESLSHFLGNVSNSLDVLIVTGKYEEASIYNGVISRMHRQLLEDAEKDSRPLYDELEFVSGYLELEKLRFKEKFAYHIHVADNVNQSAPIPVMAIHTLAENAVRHGFMHKPGTGILQIEVTIQGKYMVVTVADNGIGRRAAAEKKTASTGKGLHILKKVMQVYNRRNWKWMYLRVTDLYENDAPSGTVFSIFIPLSYKF